MTLKCILYQTEKAQMKCRIMKQLSCDTSIYTKYHFPRHVVQSVTCLSTDACLTADPGVMSLILAGSLTFMEIDHEIISLVILLSSSESFKKGCCQLKAKVCARSTG